MTPHTAAMIESGRMAGDMALAHFHQQRSVGYKADGSVASALDTAIENAIGVQLRKEFPDYRFYGEETGANENHPPRPGDYRWLIDPIDGTRNFVKGRDDFCVSLACQRFEHGAWTTTDGVVFVPVSGRVFWASRNEGAFVMDYGSTPRRLHVYPKAQAGFDHALIDLSIRSLGIDNETRLIHRLRSAGAIYRSTGTSALMLAMTAGMGSDGVITTGYDYDVAAGRIIASEAGAVSSSILLNLGGKPICVTICAQNRALHDGLRTIALSLAQKAPKASPAP